MDLATKIYSKTGKGVRALSSKSRQLPANALKVLSCIDSKTDAATILAQFEKLSESAFRILLSQLENDGYIRSMNITPTEDWGDEKFDLGAGMVVDELSAEDFFAVATEPALDTGNKTVEEQAQEEAEDKAKKDALAREIAEMETRLKAARKSREDAYRKARDEADRKAHVEEDARLKDEANAHARIEEAARVAAEYLAREEAERLTREKSDRTAAARLEAERKAHEEKEARRKAEAEARAKAEKEAERRARAEEEVRRQAEVEARARAEAAARLEAERLAREAAERKAREEEEARLKAEEKARQEAERLAREEAERQAEAEARARAEAAARLEAERLAREAAERKAREEAERKEEEARLKAEEKARVKAEKEAQLEAERLAREEAERQVRAEEETRRRAEAEARARAEEAARLEAERLAREAAERLAREEAKHKAREEKENRLNAAAEARAKAKEEAQQQAEHRTREKIERRLEKKFRAKAMRRAAQPGKWATVASKILFIYMPLALVAMLGLLHFVNLGVVAGPLERLASDTIGEPVTVRDVRVSLFPMPHLKLSGITIGAEADMQIGSIQVSPTPLTLFDEAKTLKSFEIERLVVDAASLDRQMRWISTSARTGKLRIEQITLRQVSFKVPGLDLAPFDGKIGLLPSGDFSMIELGSADHNLTLQLTPENGDYQMALTASNWQPPFGTPLQFNELRAEGIVTGNQVRFSRIEGRLYGGTFKANGVVKWSAQPSASGNFELENVSLPLALSSMGSSASVDGTLKATGSFASKASEVGKLAEAVEISAAFTATEGQINGIDLASSMVPGGNRVTRFDKLTGNLQFRNGIYQYRRLALDTAQFHARGNLDVQSTQEISGSVTAELAVPSRRMNSNFSLGGNVGSVRLQ